jgi:hypothetical protein
MEVRKMNKEKLFRELIKYEDDEIIAILHIESGEEAIGEVHNLMYQWIVDMEVLFSDMFSKQMYELRIPSDKEMGELQEDLESNFRYGF